MPKYWMSWLGACATASVIVSNADTTVRGCPAAHPGAEVSFLFVFCKYALASRSALHLGSHHCDAAAHGCEVQFFFSCVLPAC